MKTHTSDHWSEIVRIVRSNTLRNLYESEAHYLAETDSMAHEISKYVNALEDSIRAEERERIKDLLRDKGCGFCNYNTDLMIDESLSQPTERKS